MACDGAETAGGLFSEGPDLLEDVRCGGRARHTPENDTAEQRRTTKTVRAVDGDTGGLTSGVQSRNDLVLAVLFLV